MDGHILHWSIIALFGSAVLGSLALDLVTEARQREAAERERRGQRPPRGTR